MVSKNALLENRIHMQIDGVKPQSYTLYLELKN